MAKTAMASRTGLIGLDWGTSSLRAFRLGLRGQVLDVRQRPFGVMHLPPVPSGPADVQRGAAFERALQDTCGDWLDAMPSLPLLACGMVGSAQGWREAPYLDIPASLDQLARGLTVVRRGAGMPLHIVPGLLQRTGLPNVMRGEETQVLGVLAASPLAGDAPLLVGLPGTHSKWVLTRQRSFLEFHTFMTGEVFAALCGHTILGKTMDAPSASGGAAFDHPAFLRGLELARGEEADKGLLSHIFSTRTLGLTGALPPSAQADYLSGILIGQEIASLARLHPPSGAASRRLVLCGESDLCRRYTIALQAYGFKTPAIAVQAAATGLWQIAQTAGLVAHGVKARSASEDFTA